MKIEKGQPKEYPTENLTFARPETGRFQISNSALIVLRSFVQDDAKKAEAGGVLLGRHILETDDIIVDRISEPLPGDRRKRFSFFRGQQQHQRVIDEAWQLSNGTCTYLGEWHTHPEQYPSPSILDRMEWKQKIRVDKFSEPIFFVIVGTSQICVWEGQRNKPLKQLDMLG